jgi:hypothetical protein
MMTGMRFSTISLHHLDSISSALPFHVLYKAPAEPFSDNLCSLTLCSIRIFIIAIEKVKCDRNGMSLTPFELPRRNAQHVRLVQSAAFKCHSQLCFTALSNFIATPDTQ